MTPEGKQAATALLNCLNEVASVFPDTLPPTINNMIASIEASGLDANVKQRAAEALRLCEGYHIIGSILGQPHGFPTLEAMRVGVTQKMNARYPQ